MYSLINILRKFFHSYFAFFLAVSASPAWSETKCGADECSVNVTFHGKYLEETCEININDNGNEETVTLQEISVKSLYEDGSEAGSEPFSVSLNNCPYNRKVLLYFKKGAAGFDTATGNLLNRQGDEYAENVQVRLRKEDGSLIVIDKLDSMQRYNIPASGEAVKHTYTASYYAKGKQKVTAGEVETQAEVEVIYE